MSRYRLLAAAASLTLLAGCLTPGMGGLSMDATISGGEKVRIDFDSHGVIHAEDDDVRILSATLVPDFKLKKVGYEFSFEEKHGHGETPKSVTVDDVTDDTALNLLVDNHPSLDAKGKWIDKIPPFDPTSSKVAWLNEIESAIRVYRFTIVTADNRTLVLYEGASYQAFVKKYFREQLGLEKMDKH